MEFFVPPQIDVCSAQGRDRFEQMYSASDVEPSSALFRRHSAAGITLGAVNESVNKAEELLVVSAGCSFGPEIDTILSLSHRNMPGRRLSVLGLDMNEDMLEEAATGVYHANEHPDSYRKMFADQDEKLDFDSEMAAYGIRFDAAVEPGGQERMLLDTAELRSRYPVELQRADLRSEWPADRAAHLILCNYVLCHNTREEARTIVKNLAGGLAVGGIVSFGIASLTSNRRITQPGQRPSVVPDWWSGVADELAETGVVPLAPQHSGLRAFQRAA